MARTRVRSRPWRPQLTDHERCRGIVFFLLYLLVFPFLMAFVQRLFDERWGLFLSVAAANALYYYFSAAMVLLVFWSFLKHGFFILLDWLPENLFAYVTGLLGFFALRFLAGLIPLPVENPALTDYAEQFLFVPGTTTVILVLLMPLIEETLFRGLLFGSVRRQSRPLAYALSIQLFSLFKVWQFAFAESDPRYLLLALSYVPMAAALTWCYDNGGSIWSAVALHMTISGVSLWALVR